LFELLEVILQKMNSEEVRIPMATQMSEVVLVLVAKLREQRMYEFEAREGT
jgi:pyruvate/2-oxoglutarate dehydrogenase complex dihydrolipoamide acyltransferase (E2) component